jgi:hypothetical protein
MFGILGVFANFAAHNFLSQSARLHPSGEPTMHATLFSYPATLARYRGAPLLAKRERFLV